MSVENKSNLGLPHVHAHSDGETMVVKNNGGERGRLKKNLYEWM